MTLRQMKVQATKDEKRRVFHGMNAPQPIVIYHGGEYWQRRLWRSLNQFGWCRWERVS